MRMSYSWRGWLVTFIAIVGALYAAYSVSTDTGIGGRIIYMQTGGDGRYSSKLSFLLTWVAVTLPALAAFAVVLRLFGIPMERARQTATSQPIQPARQASKWTMVLVGLGIVVSGWAVAAGVYVWQNHTDAADRESTYVDFTINSDTKATAPSSHLRLSARALTDHALAFGTKDAAGRTETNHWIVPLGHAAWRDRDHVGWILRLPPMGKDDLRNRPNGPWLAKTKGEAPRHAIEALKKHGLAVDTSTRMLEWVPSSGGVPQLSTVESNFWDSDALVVAGLFTLVGVVFIGLYVLQPNKPRAA